MQDSYYLGAYWGPRKESPQNCAAKLTDFLLCLKRHDQLFKQWYGRGVTRNDALGQRIEIDKPFLESYILKKITKSKGHSTNIDDDLGVHFSIWAEEVDGGSASISITCGCYADNPNLNSCVIDLPTIGQSANRVLNTSKLIEMMSCMILAWQPDWAVVNSRKYREMAKVKQNSTPLGGWISYLSRQYIPLHQIPPVAKLLSSPEGGLFIVATDEKFSSDNEKHIAVANAIAESLRSLRRS